LILLKYTGPVFNTNHGYVITTIGKHARRFKKPEVSKYQKEFESAARHYRKHFDFFDPKKDYIEMKIYWYNPKFFTAKKELSKTSGDTDGIVKFIKDGIANGIGINDAFFKNESIVQLPSTNKEHHLLISVSIESIHNLINEFKMNFEE